MRDQRHFLTGVFTSHAGYLSDDFYSVILDNIVVACVDCVFLYQGKMLLGKRTREPQPDWWIIGGRMLPGESFIDSAIRNSQRELSLNLKAERFGYLGTYSLVWGRRSQVPVEHGRHDVSNVLIYKIQRSEVKKINPNDEYEDLKWVKPETVVQGNLYHPAIVQIARDLLKTQ